MVHQTVLDWFCLINSKGIGPKTFWSLLRAYKTAQESLKHVATPFSTKEASKILTDFSGRIILASDPIFPSELRRSTSCPPMLFCRGNIDLLKTQKIAIIGARNASINGKSIASKLSGDLSQYFTIVSGLANGIDTSAHLGVLRRNKNNTIAVMPFSFNNIYPKENTKLFEEISNKGLVLTEVPPQKNPDQGMFHARNRIISLLSPGVIVIEGALKSGTIAAAKMALDIGSEVMAVPGSPSDPRSRGCNNLIKNGAPLVEDYADVLDILGCTQTSTEQPKLKLHDNSTPKYDDISNDILSMLSVDLPTNLEIIAQKLNIDMKELLRNISELEILGRIYKCSTNEVMLNA